MSRDTTVILFRQPDAIDDPLTKIAREGARRMLAQVLMVEADALVAQWKDLKLPNGRDRVVRHVMGRSALSRPGLGLSKSGAPRCETGLRSKLIRKSASLRRSFRSGSGEPGVSTRCCRFYLRGVSTSHFQEALDATYSHACAGRVTGLRKDRTAPRALNLRVLQWGFRLRGKETYVL